MNKKDAEAYVKELMKQHGDYHKAVEDQKYVTVGSIIACTCGSILAKLTAEQVTAVYVGNGAPVLTCSDCETGINIPTFGTCRCPESTRMGLPGRKAGTWGSATNPSGGMYTPYGYQCIPLIDDEWKQPKSKNLIWKDSTGKYSYALLDIGILVCRYGGTIGVIEVNTGGTKGSGNELVTMSQMSSFNFPISADELKELNKALNDYGITDKSSIALFMATCGHESGKGTIVLEKLNANGTTVGNYLPTERGAGYIQLTWRATHLKFLATIPDTFSGTDTVTYISQNYPWQAAAWFWTSTDAKSIGKSPSLTINEYVEQYGDSSGIYLLTQYAVNGWADSPSNTILSDIRDGKISWTIANGRVFVNGADVGRAPNGWNDATNIYNREITYNEATMHFQ